MAQAKKKKKQGLNFDKNKLVLYVGIVLLALAAFVTVYVYTDGNLSNITGSAMTCSNETGKPTVVIKKVENIGESVAVTVEATDDCALSKVRVEQSIYKINGTEKTLALELANYDDILDEKVFSKTYVFTKSEYPLSNAEVIVEFIAFDTTGNQQNVVMETFNI